MSRRFRSEMVVLLTIVVLLLAGCTQAQPNNTSEGIAAPSPTVTFVVATNTPTFAPTLELEATETPTPTVEITDPAVSPSPEATNTPTPTMKARVTATVTPTKTPTPKVTNTPVPTSAPTITVQPTPTNSPIPTATATPTPEAGNDASFVTVLEGSNGTITNAINNAPAGAILVISVVCTDENKAKPGYQIGGVCIDGGWSVDNRYIIMIDKYPVLDERLVFTFSIDSIKRAASGDINVNIYSGYEVYKVLIGGANAVYTLPTPTASPKPDGIAISGDVFPDDALRQYVVQKCDKNGNGYLDRMEIEEVKAMSLSGISNFAGIENFQSLFLLRATCTGDVRIDLTKLKNGLGSLSLTGGNFVEFKIDSKVSSLILVNTKIPSFNPSNYPWLFSLSITGMSVPGLDLRGCSELNSLELSKLSNVSSLDLSKNSQLRVLGLNSIGVDTVDVSNNGNLENVLIGPNITLIGLKEGVQTQEYYPMVTYIGY